jgi:hypothetical protein
MLIQIKNLPYGPEAADKVEHYLKHIDFIEQERDAEGESHKLQKDQSQEYQAGCEYRPITCLILWRVLTIT